MNLRDLKYLIAVAKHKSFSKAAKESFISQPALSMQLKKLEEELGVELFERNNKSVMITDIGEKILHHAEFIIQKEKEIKEIAQESISPFMGDLKIGAFPTISPYILPRIVPKLHEDLPQLKTYLIEEKTEVLLSKLKNGELDAAFIALPINSESFEYKIVLEDPFYLAVSHKHKLAHKTSVTENDLKDECLLLLDEGHCLRDQALDICTTTGICENQDFRATSLETLRQMVAANVGATLIPEIARREDDGLVYIPFKGTAPKRDIALVWRKTTTKARVLEEALKIVQKTL